MRNRTIPKGASRQPLHRNRRLLFQALGRRISFGFRDSVFGFVPFPILRTAILLLAAAALSGCRLTPPAAADGPDTVYAGLRRSSYGPGKTRNGDEWWIARARDFAGSLSDRRRTVRPAIIEIVSVYLDDGTCQAEFARPPGFRARAPAIAFVPSRRVDHEQALAAYDRAGVRAIVQMETGSADVETCLELMNAAFGRHPCVIGYGIDAEWFHCRGSKDKAGRPITDAEAGQWMRRLATLDPKRGLFLKHFDRRHLPPSYRHPKLWFIDDSQEFTGPTHLQKEFEEWGRAYAPSAVGFQFGYPKDSRWWQKLSCPPRDIGRPLLDRIPNTRFVFWVDFTAADTEFKDSKDRNGR